MLSHVWLFVTSWTVACQASLSMEFSRQEYWSGLSFPSLGVLSNPGIKPVSLVSPDLSGGFFTTSAIWEAWQFYEGPNHFSNIYLSADWLDSIIKLRVYWTMEHTTAYRTLGLHRHFSGICGLLSDEHEGGSEPPFSFQPGQPCFICLKTGILNKIFWRKSFGF